jgi:hypothetical protein
MDALKLFFASFTYCFGYPLESIEVPCDEIRDCVYAQLLNLAEEVSAGCFKQGDFSLDELIDVGKVEHIRQMNAAVLTDHSQDLVVELTLVELVESTAHLLLVQVKQLVKPGKEAKLARFLLVGWHN